MPSKEPQPENDRTAIFRTHDERRLDAKESLYITPEKARRSVCCYSGDPCDCKYGRGPKTRSDGEQTGCPELRDLIRELTGWSPYNRGQSVEADAAKLRQLEEIREMTRTDRDGST